MPQTLTELIRQVYSRINEAAASPRAQLDSGVNQTPVITSDAQVTEYLNDGQRDLCRSCFALPARAQASLAAGGAEVKLSALTAAAGYAGCTLWSARGVRWGDVSLAFCGRAALETRYPAYLSDPAGTPRWWYESGQERIAVYPVPGTTRPLLVDGLSEPPPLVAGADTAAWCPDAIADLLVYYAAAQVCLKNADDGSLYPRAGIWLSAYDAGRQNLWEQLSPALRRAHYPVPPGGERKE